MSITSTVVENSSIIESYRIITIRSLGLMGENKEDPQHVGKVLEITFKNGSKYKYDHVPPKVTKAFESASSKGAFFHEHIRSQYAALKIETQK